jgi:hypothetical protein
MTPGESEGREDGPALPARTTLPPELLAEIRSAILEAGVGADSRSVQAPLRELAEALRANAGAMQRMQETQERIARSVDSSDRSEAVIQSTQALNDTFRGVRKAQEALVGRLEVEQKRPLRAALLGAAVALVAAGGVAAFFLTRQDAFQARVDGLRGELLTALATAGERGGDPEAERVLLGRLAELEARSARSDADRSHAESGLESIQGDLATLRRENEVLAEREREASLRVARQGTLEEEIARLRRDLAASRGEGDEAKRLLAQREGELTALRSVVVPAPAAGATTPEAAGALPNPAPSATGATAGDGERRPVVDAATTAPATGAVPAGLGAAAITATVEVNRLLESLNLLLVKAEGRDTWRLLSAEAVDGTRLVGVVLETRDPQGTETRRFEAREVRLVLRPDSRSLEIRMRQGAVRYMGRLRVAFMDDLYAAHLSVDPKVLRDAGHPLVEIP